MATRRAQQLQTLAAKIPGANQQVQAGLEAARQTQLQQTIGQMQPGAVGPGTAQQLGAQQAAKAGETALQTAQQTQRQQTQLGQLGLQQAGREQRQQAFERGIGLTEKQREQAGQLARLGRDIKSQILDSQLTFNRDQAGQTLMNQRQLADYALASAQSEEELANYMQDIEQVNQRELDLLEQSYKTISRAIERGVTERNKKLTREQRLDLLNKKRNLEDSLRQKQIEAANRQAIFQTGGTLLGGVAGGAATGGSPAGISAGMKAGAGVGSIFSGL